MFLQNCYIHKRTPELIKKLINLGYRYSNQYDNTCDALHTRIGNFYASPHFVDEHYSDMDPTSDFDGIDCKENEELFLAIVALRDDSDKNQWFVHNNKVFGNSGWEFCKDDKFQMIFYAGEIGDNEYFTDATDKFHKATVEELIEHFK